MVFRNPATFNSDKKKWSTVGVRVHFTNTITNIMIVLSLMFAIIMSPTEINASAIEDKGKVVIDAGHGGWHHGATGNGLKEKDLTLSISRKLNKYLNDNYLVDTKMTRDSDTYLTLDERTSIANSWGADLFLSVHVNSSESGLLSGYEDFTHNDRSSPNHNAEVEFQENIHNEVEKLLGDYSVVNRGMKQENFYVLRETNMPAILTESLFINNFKDSELLRRDSFLNDIAKAYGEGVAKTLNLPRSEEINATSYKTIANLNVRTNPGLENPVVKTLRNDTEVYIQEIVHKSDTSWGYIAGVDNSGWVSMDYIKLTKGSYTTLANLNVRSNAGMDGDIRATAKKGTHVEIMKMVETDNGVWGYGAANGELGWMSMSYLKENS